MARGLLSMAAAVSVASLASGYVQAPVTADMRSAASQIISTLLPPQGVTQQSSNVWSRLAYITDTFGPRFSGSQNLEDALEWVKAQALADGLTVTEMPTLVPKWVRGEEWAYLMSPRKKKLHMVGLGMSTSSGGVNITAPVFVVRDNVELQAGTNCSKAAGKIVLFNTPFDTYGNTVGTRSGAGKWASACGGVAALIRSIGPYSLQNPHTGFTQNATIPAAALSLEDASQIQRMFDRGQAPVVSLFMDSVLYPPSPSRNLLIDLPGSERPLEYVMIGGHADSWDIAEGAMDDGGGFVSSWEAVRVLKQLGLQPKRTVRAVIWVNEENGSAGGNQYLNDLNATGALLNHSIALETDSGAFTPLGIGLSCSCGVGPCNNGGCGAAIAQLATIGSALLGGIGSGNVSEGGGGTDIDPACSTGIPCSGLNVMDTRLTPGENNPCTVDAMGAWGLPRDINWQSQYDSQYFWIHHSEADTVERLDPTQLNTVAASLAVWAYSIAQLPELLPRDAPAPPGPSPGPGPDNGGGSAGVVAGSVVGSVLGLAFLVWAYKQASTRGHFDAVANWGSRRRNANNMMPSAAYSAMMQQAQPV